MRILGIELPSNKSLEISLTHIFGIGRPMAKKILEATNIENKKTFECTEEEGAILTSYIEKHIKCEGELRAEIHMNIKSLCDIRCYRGIRHKKNLPTRGQRTRTNCRTRKGPRKTVANKKKAEK